MSGGIAYVFDKNNTFTKQCVSEGLNLLRVEEDNDMKQLKDLIESHYNSTLSPLAQRILENWEEYLPKFIKVLPEEYRQALIRLEKEKVETI
jgi:glutamate synthase (ferredoxin)